MPRPAVLSLTFIVLIFLAEMSAAEVGSMDDGILQSARTLGKIQTRKVLAETTMDYDYGGPNPRHDPGRRGKGNGGGGKSP